MIETTSILWKLENLNMVQESYKSLYKYRLSFIIKLGYVMSPHFCATDINLGMDTTGNFDWITDEGRFSLIYNSSDLTEEEKSMLLTDIKFI